MSDVERHIYDIGDTKITLGVEQLWALPEADQETVLAETMRRWDYNTPSEENLRALGLDFQAADLVRRRDRYHAGRLNDRDIWACALLGNFEVFPLEAMKNLKEDGLDSGVWDGVLGKPGYYFEQNPHFTFDLVNAGDERQIKDFWGDPKEIPRARTIYETEYPEIARGWKRDDGLIIMKPNLAYLFGIWPAVRVRGLNIDLQTRSNPARWSFNGQVNSVTVHDRFAGVCTAEAISFAKTSFVLNTSWLPLQMIFDYKARGLERPQTATFGDNVPGRTLKEVAEALKPEVMLPRVMRRERNIEIIYQSEIHQSE